MRAPVLAALVWLSATAATTAAVRVHFVSGGSMTAERAWSEGGNLMLQSKGGVMGFPLELVARIETLDGEAPAREPERAKARVPAPAAPSDASLEAATAAVQEGDLDRAVLHYHRALQQEPGRVEARVGYALVEMARGRDPMALASVLDGLALSPGEPELLEILGDLRDREERVEDALRAWREAQRAAPEPRLAGKIAKAERELAAARDYAYSATSHFTVRHEGDLDDSFAEAILDFLERRWGDLTSSFRHAPPQPVTVILYPERAFRDVTQAPDEVGGLYDGKIRVPLGGLRRLDPSLERVLSHELAHAIVHSKTRGRAPRWLHEGLAQWAEPRPLTGAQVAEVRGRVAEGDAATWADRAFSYPASLSLLRWLESERGFDAVVSVLERLGDGVPLDEAFAGVFGQPYGDLCRRWAGSLGGGAAR